MDPLARPGLQVGLRIARHRSSWPVLTAPTWLDGPTQAEAEAHSRAPGDGHHGHAAAGGARGRVQQDSAVSRCVAGVLSPHALESASCQKAGKPSNATVSLNILHLWYFLSMIACRVRLRFRAEARRYLVTGGCDIRSKWGAARRQVAFGRTRPHLIDRRLAQCFIALESKAN